MKREVNNPESVADHMFRMGLMALIASDMTGVDRNKLGFIFIYFYFLSFLCSIEVRRWLGIEIFFFLNF